MPHVVPPVVYVHLFVAVAAIADAFTLVPGRLLGNLLWKGRWAC